MAMDNFKEEVIVKRHNGLNNVVYYLMWVIMIANALIGFMMIQSVIYSIQTGFDWVSLIACLLLIGIAVLIWWKKDGLRVEYEYTFTNGTLDVSEVLNNSKRKYLAEIPMKLVESAGSVLNPSFNRYINDKNIKKHNWFLNRDADLIYLYFTKNGVKRLAILEPSAEMQDMMHSRGYMNFGVWQETK